MKERWREGGREGRKKGGEEQSAEESLKSRIEYAPCLETSLALCGCYKGWEDEVGRDG